MPDAAELKKYYRELGDNALAGAIAEGPGAYAPEVWAVIEAESNSRAGRADRAGLKRSSETAVQRATTATREAIKGTQRAIALNAVIAAVGLALALGLFAPADWRFFVAWGAVLFGAVRGAFGIVRLRRMQRELEQAQSMQPDAPAKGDGATRKRK